MGEQTKNKILMNADCLEAMKKMPDNCIDAIVTDPPYGLSFMGKNWDFGVPGVEFWKEALRIAKPGAHLLSFGGTRTFHRIACAIEDAGWEIRDTIMWVYGSGFPKSMDISKAIDKKFGQEREKFPNPLANKQTAQKGTLAHGDREGNSYISPILVSDEAKKWNGWGTCLKPAYEPVIMARKPVEGTVVDNILKHGTGGINIDGCRVPVDGETVCTHSKNAKSDIYSEYSPVDTHQSDGQKLGRFPANIIHDNSKEVVELFPDTGKSTGGRTVKRSGGGNVGSGKKSEASWTNEDPGFGDSGSAARFFYCAKASKSEKGKDNPHPTVKPLELMKYLIKMVAPENALVLDPFMGSGSTGVAVIQIGRRFIGVEKEEEYFNYAKKRIEAALQKDGKKV